MANGTWWSHLWHLSWYLIFVSSQVVGNFLDFSKAFDTIGHDILLLKLQHYGVKEPTLGWFKNDLNARYQYAMCKGTKSYKISGSMWISTRIDRGASSILIYVTDLHKVVKYIFLLLFADDSNSSYTGKAW